MLLGASASLSALRPPVRVWPSVLAVAALVAGVTILVLTLRQELLSRQWKVSLLAPLALLPALQFWHATSFVPAQLRTSVGATATVTGQQLAAGATRGVVDVDIRNSGEVPALVLASELILCFDTDPGMVRTQQQLYDDDTCQTHVIFNNLAELDSRSTWKIRQVFSRPPDRSTRVQRALARPVVQVAVLLWYARHDRLRIDDASEKRFPGAPGCRPGDLTRYDVVGESRYKSLVQKPRRLLYLDTREGGDAYFALSTRNEPFCGQDGLPRHSRHDIGEYVGLATLRLNHSDWLAAPGAGGAGR